MTFPLQPQFMWISQLAMFDFQRVTMVTIINNQ